MTDFQKLTNLLVDFDIPFNMYGKNHSRSCSTIHAGDAEGLLIRNDIVEIGGEK